MAWTADSLDDFVATSDKLGGPEAPACQAFWLDFQYDPTIKVDITLDPFGIEYADRQMLLYEELSGHPYNVEANEQTFFDIDRHVAAVNPYDHGDATMMGVHLQRLSRAFSCANVRRGELLLDMGCGWGLSSEVAAYLGLRVQGVDINPDFVELVNRRAARTGLPISAVQSSFEDYTGQEPADLVLFYECLHHATNPLKIMKHCANALRPGGRIILAGEPINDIWWPHWGMRLDALSIYCIRRFGWFETGWSMNHIQLVMRAAGLVPRLYLHPDGIVGPVIVGEKTIEPITQAKTNTIARNEFVVEGRLRRAWRRTVPWSLRRLIYKLRSSVRP